MLRVSINVSVQASPRVEQSSDDCGAKRAEGTHRLDLEVHRDEREDKDLSAVSSVIISAFHGRGSW